MNIYYVLIFLSLIIILSYFFNLISKWSHVPSVLLLLLTGIGIKIGLKEFPVNQDLVNQLVQLLGVAGLIMIVLEAGLDLHVHKDKLWMVTKAFLSAFIILILSTFTISFLFVHWMEIPWNSAVVYSLPLSVISSAIIIPSLEHLHPDKKEFMIYEASFSDILGILIFNIVAKTDSSAGSTILGFVGNLSFMMIISVAMSILLLYLVSKVTTPVKFFLLIAIILLLYSAGKLQNLPTLLLVLIFGLVLNNFEMLMKYKAFHFIDVQQFTSVLNLFKSLTAETSFLIRTFFFIVFGFSIELITLINLNVILLSVSILAILLVIRTIYFRVFLKSKLFPEAFLMPRGLITVLLFYSIPKQLQVTNFEQGIVLLVIVLSTLLMTVGLVFFNEPSTE